MLAIVSTCSEWSAQERGVARSLIALLALRSRTSNIFTCSATSVSLPSSIEGIANPFFPLNIAMIDLPVQQSHWELLRCIQALEEKCDKRIKSLETRMEGRMGFLERRMNRLNDRLQLLDNRINNVDGRIIILDGRIDKSGDRIDKIEARTTKALDDSEKRIKQLEQRLDNVGAHREKILAKSERDLKVTLRLL